MSTGAAPGGTPRTRPSKPLGGPCHSVALSALTNAARLAQPSSTRPAQRRRGAALPQARPLFRPLRRHRSALDLRSAHQQALHAQDQSAQARRPKRVLKVLQSRQPARPQAYLVGRGAPLSPSLPRERGGRFARSPPRPSPSMGESYRGRAEWALARLGVRRTDRPKKRASTSPGSGTKASPTLTTSPRRSPSRKRSLKTCKPH